MALRTLRPTHNTSIKFRGAILVKIAFGVKRRRFEVGSKPWIVTGSIFTAVLAWLVLLRLNAVDAQIKHWVWVGLRDGVQRHYVGWEARVELRLAGAPFFPRLLSGSEPLQKHLFLDVRAVVVTAHSRTGRVSLVASRDTSRVFDGLVVLGRRGLGMVVRRDSFDKGRRLLVHKLGCAHSKTLVLLLKAKTALVVSTEWVCRRVDYNLTHCLVVFGGVNYTAFWVGDVRVTQWSVVCLRQRLLSKGNHLLVRHTYVPLVWLSLSCRLCFEHEFFILLFLRHGAT